MGNIKFFFDQINKGEIKGYESEIILLKITDNYNLTKTKVLLEDFNKYFNTERAIRDAGIDPITFITKPYIPENDFDFFYCYQFRKFLIQKIARLSNESINYNTDLSEINLEVNVKQSNNILKDDKIPKIFKSNVSYSFFIALKDTLHDKHIFSKYSFIFHYLLKDGYLEKKTQQQDFILFLKEENFISEEEDWSQLKPNRAKKRIKQYNDLKHQYPLKKK